MIEKLLHKTLFIYLVFSMVVMCIVAPLFYFISEKLYFNDADEALLESKIAFVKNTLPKLKISDIEVSNKINTNFKISLNTNNLLKDTIILETNYNKLSDENEPYHVLKSPISVENQKYIYSEKINLVESEDLIESIAILFFIMFILLLIGLFIITKFVSVKMWSPFYKTVDEIEKFEIDKNFNPNFEKTKIEEFNRLNESLSKLITKNTEIFKSQREFIENAAHELQTPLAIFQSQIDTLFQNQDITAEQSRILDNLNETVVRLNRLNKNLLLLSKIDKTNFNTFENISVNAIFEKQLTFFTEQAKAKNIQIFTNLSENSIVKTNTTLVEIIISNLFLNAIKHNIFLGTITVNIEKSKLVFINSGIDKPLDTTKLFDRFSKSNPSSTGNGLGLAIIKKIADINNWKINYSFSNHLHYFTVEF
ncbi:MAG: HAMP domain-containing histidine kinase [Flavobacterium sp.]|nr:HAMP domain-containing histidine kinase [Flavobacterium sp.]